MFDFFVSFLFLKISRKSLNYRYLLIWTSWRLFFQNRKNSIYKNIFFLNRKNVFFFYRQISNIFFFNIDFFSKIENKMKIWIFWNVEIFWEFSRFSKNFAYFQWFSRFFDFQTFLPSSHIRGMRRKTHCFLCVCLSR